MKESKRRIVPHLWFDNQAKEAAQFYCSIFPKSRIQDLSVLRDTPSGDCDVVTFDLWDQPFMSISAGPLFQFNPSVSFMVHAKGEIDRIWKKLSEGGKALIPLDKHPTCEKYGWIQDRYGLSWQLLGSPVAREPRPSIVPSLLFTGKNSGHAEECVRYYVSVFNRAAVKHGESRVGSVHRKGDTIQFADFRLFDQWLGIMESASAGKSDFSEAISFMVYCDTQNEIDYYWKTLSAVAEAEQCGWLKDKYRVSWQIVPSDMHKVMKESSPEQLKRYTKAFLKMKKFNIAELNKARDGKGTK